MTYLPSTSGHDRARGAWLAPGAAFYSKPILALYDINVLGFSNAFVWKCPTRLIVDHYNAHVTGRHLDVGVGTGYFLDHCTFPVRHPSLTLMDLNPNSLSMAAQRVRRYHPLAVLADVAAPVRPPTTPFDSIGLGYLLHCLPGTMHDKVATIDHLAALLNPGGVLFGTTILGTGVPHTQLARRFLRFYNHRGVFSNRNDSRQALIEVLAARFRPTSVHVRVEGSVALFAARC